MISVLVIIQVHMQSVSDHVQADLMAFSGYSIAPTLYTHDNSYLHCFFGHAQERCGNLS